MIYKIQLTDGTFAIIHISRLKRACGLTGSNKVVLGKGKAKETVKLHQGKGDIFESNVDLTDWEESNVEIPSQSQVVSTEDAELHESEDEADNLLSDGNDEEPEWNPGSLYLQRKLRSDVKTADVAYQLHSRQVGRSGQETPQDKSSTGEGDLAGSTSALADAIDDETGTVSRHPYDLRSRASPMSSAN